MDKRRLYVWSHSNPSDLYYVTDEIDRVCKEVDWDGTDYNYMLNEQPEGKLTGLAWNDEHGYMWDIPGATIAKAYKEDISYIAEQLKEQDVTEYIYVESNILGGAYENSVEDMDKEPTPENILEAIKTIIEQSEVDGDSSYGRIIIDQDTHMVHLGRDVIQMTGQEFLNRFRDE